MPRQLRYVEPGNLVEVTNRTIQGRLLLRPSPHFNEILLGILGWAQGFTGLIIHAVVVLSNHYHLLCSPKDAKQLSKFEELFNSRLAKEVARLHGWRDKVWKDRYRPIPVSQEPAAQVARLLYILSHGCKEGFVMTPGDWPGVHCVDALLNGTVLRGTLYDRSREYEANRKGEAFDVKAFATEQSVELTPLPCWQGLSAEQIRANVVELIALVEAQARQRQRETGRAPLGAAAVRSQHPHALPYHSKRSPAPAVHAASKAVRQTIIASYRAFVAAYRRAAELLRAGVLDVEFPPGCFPPALAFARAAPGLAPGFGTPG